MSQRQVNRLSRETSPYLLQHQHNPVDWYAWGPEAFQASRSQDKPIFLSAGYSTCYWCHVMERQCFENEAIAALMNELFINIKVDREERPDVDQLYMTAVQVLTRHGGWPMSVFLLPDLRPFYGGTYFPPEDAHGRAGFPTVLRSVSDAFKNRCKEVEASADQLVSILKQLARPLAVSHPVTIDDALIDELIERSVADYEPRFGGFGSAPKFPRETLLEMLLVANRHAPSERRINMLRHTLDAMANGGIRDQLGGAFHRYSTDDRWIVPHFEIMLYDNAMLAWCYVEAHRQTGEARYVSTARGIFEFVRSNMTSPGGAFYTAIDAEADAREGEPYLWTAQQVEQVLGAADAKLFNRVYGLDRGPNFADPHHGDGVPDRNVLYLPGGAAKPPDDTRLVALRKKLLEARNRRKQPLLDTKIITGWNALMIRALAYAGQVLNQPELIDWAATAADFLLRHHRREDGRLWRTSRDGHAKYDGFLDDYAFLLQALLALHDAGDKSLPWRDRAQELARILEDGFADPAGGFYFTERGASDLIIRQMIGTDSPLPSGNAVAAMVMMQLDRPQVARDLISTFAAQLSANAEGMSAMLQAAHEYVLVHGEIEVKPVPGAAPDERILPPQEQAARVVAMQAAWRDPRTLELRARIAAGFHLPSNHPSDATIATELRAADGADVESIEFPSAVSRQFPFADKPIDVFENEILILIRFKSDQSGRPAIHFSFRYQACDESACLTPVTIQFEVPAP